MRFPRRRRRTPGLYAEPRQRGALRRGPDVPRELVPLQERERRGAQERALRQRDGAQGLGRALRLLLRLGLPRRARLPRRLRHEPEPDARARALRHAHRGRVLQQADARGDGDDRDGQRGDGPADLHGDRRRARQGGRHHAQRQVRDLRPAALRRSDGLLSRVPRARPRRHRPVLDLHGTGRDAGRLRRDGRALGLPGRGESPRSRLVRRQPRHVRQVGHLLAVDDAHQAPGPLRRLRGSLRRRPHHGGVGRRGRHPGPVRPPEARVARARALRRPHRG
mmetsp:Transcript_30693/g.100651  ORF Transcript_30693/g.100651 Transcript_30693/m.100651 type:complete len:279 (+) Transcript_30693:3835-4671(+)